MPGSALAAMEPVPLHSPSSFALDGKLVQKTCQLAAEGNRSPQSTRQKGKFAPVLSKFSLYLPLTWRQQTVKHQGVNEWLQEAFLSHMTLALPCVTTSSPLAPVA